MIVRILLLTLFLSFPARGIAAANPIALFPDPATVAQRIDRGDPVETALWQNDVLGRLMVLIAETVLHDGSSELARQQMDRYLREQNAAIERGIAALRGDAMSAAAAQSARAEFEWRKERFVPGPDAVDLAFGMLPAELRSRFQSIEAHMRDEQSHQRFELLMQRVEPRLATPIDEWEVAEYGALLQQRLLYASADLPPSWQSPVQQVVLLPGAVWVALLCVWLAWGIRRATRRFELDPETPDHFWNGPRRYRFESSVGYVIDVQERTAVTETTTATTAPDPLGNDRTRYSTHYTTTERQRIHLRSPAGSEYVLNTVNFELPVRARQHLLAVAAYKGRAKQGTWVFYHIYEMERSFFRSELRDVVKLRPRVFIPFVLLSTWAAGWLALLAAPILYVITLKLLTRRRLKRFQQQYAPRIIAARHADVNHDQMFTTAR